MGSRLEKTMLPGNRFLIRESVARGGMTEIYKGEDLDAETTVAIKVFDRDRHQPDILAESFRREVRALERLRHPNIVKILDHGETSDGLPYLALEFLPENLASHKRVIPDGIESWDHFVAEIAMPVLQALAYSHSRGICHRDVKPANILIDIDGTVKLADFGIAKLKHELSNPNITFNEYSSRPFSAPESDPRAMGSYTRDVFSFAATCAWAVSANAELLDRSDLVAAIEAAAIPKEVAATLLGCLAENPADRLPSAIELEAELGPIWRRDRAKVTLDNKPLFSIKILESPLRVLSEKLDMDAWDPKIPSMIAHELLCDPRVDWWFDRDSRKPVEGQFHVLGESLSFHVAQSRYGDDELVVIQVLTWDKLGLLESKKDKLSPLPIRLSPDCSALRSECTIEEAVSFMAEACASAGKGDDAPLDKADKFFQELDRSLDAILDHSRNRRRPIRFKEAEVQGNLISVVTDVDLADIDLEEPWVLEDGERNYCYCEVYRKTDGQIQFWASDTSRIMAIRDGGVAKFDDWASRVSIERQKAAITAVNAGTNAHPSLRDLIGDPSRSLACATEDNTSYAQYGLDESQSDAMHAAVTSRDATVVHGPPGTGKTRFISSLVRETLGRNPEARILITSQTHVAIDHALEVIHKADPDLSIMRLSRPDADKRVSDSIQQFTYSKRLEAWRSDVENRARKSLSVMATKQGLDVNQIEVALTLQRIMAQRESLSGRRFQLQEIAADIDSIGNASDLDGFEQEQLEALQHQQTSLQTQQETEKQTLDRLERNFRLLHKDAAKLLVSSQGDQQEWVDSLLPSTEQGRYIRDCIDLQSEWLDRFGQDDSFVRAMCESTSVVASTCLGLASLPGTASVEYDLCIMDEAGKAQPTQALVPLANARRLVLVGDNKQLPPHEEQALRDPSLLEKYGLEGTKSYRETLFDRLALGLPNEKVKHLTRQYRMTNAIGDLISECFYDGSLITARTDLPDPHLSKIFQIDAGLPVNAVWVSTHKLKTRGERRSKTSFVNHTEAAKVMEVLLDIEDAAKASSRHFEVLLLAGYSKQVRELERRSRKLSSDLPHLRIECNTVDAVQGREADVVVFSVTRSNDKGSVGFMKDLPRVNVALSRARDLLVIIGDGMFIQSGQSSELQQVWSYLQGELSSTNKEGKTLYSPKPGCSTQVWES
ncbi:AAA domain-containing protein [bacterium]|nr:AAA domain-containing protein [bacterium]